MGYALSSLWGTWYWQNQPRFSAGNDGGGDDGDEDGGAGDTEASSGAEG